MARDLSELLESANQSLKRRDYAGAIGVLERAISLRPNDPTLFDKVGLCWLALMDGKKAIAAFNQEIALRPNGAQGYFNLGLALKMVAPSGSSQAAYRAFSKAAELAPDFLPSFVQVFHQMQSLLNWHEGRGILELGLSRNPDSPVIKVALAATLGKLGNAPEADRLFRSAREADSGAGPAYARWLQEEGQFEASAEILKDSIRLGSQEGVVYHNLAEARCFEIDGRPLAEHALDRLRRGGGNPEDRMYLHYALAKSYEEVRDFETAMRHYRDANNLAYESYRCAERFNLKAMIAESLSLQRTLTHELVSKLMEHGSPSEQPVFIVGMIRSGTTLLEQILSSHSSIRSAGEQPFWVTRAGPTVANQRGQGVDPAVVGQLAHEYLNALVQTTGEAERIIDKMPVNYRHLGLIRAAFPNARIIHLRRNPMDTAVSIYTTHLGRATNFAYNPRNIVGAYVSYLQAMEHWRAVLPSHRYIEIDYERLVTDTEPTIRQLIEFCSLPWDDACLTHDRKSSHVTTPSLWTARQPVNTASIGRWRRFEPWLGELLDLHTLELGGAEHRIESADREPNVVNSLGRE